MRKWLCIILGASLFGLFHIVTVAIPFTTQMVTGDSTMYIFLLDYPLIALAGHFPGDPLLADGLFGHSQGFWKFYLSVFGTAMYVGGGAILGYACYNGIGLLFKRIA